MNCPINKSDSKFNYNFPSINILVDGKLVKNAVNIKFTQGIYSTQIRITTLGNPKFETPGTQPVESGEHIGHLKIPASVVDTKVIVGGDIAKSLVSMEYEINKDSLSTLTFISYIPFMVEIEDCEVEWNAVKHQR